MLEFLPQRAAQAAELGRVVGIVERVAEPIEGEALGGGLRSKQ
jgi:hypothetical protein